MVQNRAMLTVADQ